MVVQRKTKYRKVIGTFQLILFLNLSTEFVRGETLTPPYFNLAEGKNITASATCGVDHEGPELFCKLIGANSENDISTNVIQGQVRNHQIVLFKLKLFQFEQNCFGKLKC